VPIVVREKCVSELIDSGVVQKSRLDMHVGKGIILDDWIRSGCILA